MKQLYYNNFFFRRLERNFQKFSILEMKKRRGKKCYAFVFRSRPAPNQFDPLPKKRMEEG